MKDYFETLMDYCMWQFQQYVEMNPTFNPCYVPVKSDKQNG